MSVLTIISNAAEAAKPANIISEAKWVRPGPRQAKLNVDAAFHADTCSGAAGAVIRDYHGHFIAASTKFIPHVASASMVEVTLVENRASVLPFCPGTIKNRDQRGHWSRFHRPGRRGPLVPVQLGPLVPVCVWNRDQRVCTCGSRRGTPGRHPLVPVPATNRDQRSSLHIYHLPPERHHRFELEFITHFSSFSSPSLKLIPIFLHHL